MTQQELLARLEQLGVTLWVDGDRIRARAARGVLTPSLQEELARRKAELLTVLPRGEAERAAPPPIRAVPRAGPLPLSFAQERLWVLHHLQPDASLDNVAVSRRLTGPLDVAALSRALGEIVRRHEALRTVFPATDGVPRQVITAPGPVALPLSDLTRLGAAGREVAAGRHAVEEAHRPFDLERGPLWRAKLLRLSAEEHRLLFTMHHAVTDGWSLGVLARELDALYGAYAAGRPSPLPELAVQYADFAAWQREWLDGQRLAAPLAYWRRQLAALPPLFELPTDHPRGRSGVPAGGTHPVRLERALIARLARLARQEGVTLFMALLGVFDVLLARYAGRDDVVVGTPVAGRRRPELEPLIGCFAQSLVLRADLSGDPTFRALLGRVREVTLAAYEHQDVPFARLVEALSPQRMPGQNPLFQVAFAFQNAPGSREFEVTPVGSVVDLTLFLWPDGEGLSGTIEYRRDLFDPETVARMAGHLEVLLEAVGHDPDRRIGAMPLLTGPERHRVLVDWNRTERPYPRERTVPEIVAAQIARAPRAVALTWEGGRLTYRQLGERAERLARILRRRGVGSGTPVGVLLPRSPELVVALLGILEAGGAYVPLEPGTPPERLRGMLDDAGVWLVLADPAFTSALPRAGLEVMPGPVPTLLDGAPEVEPAGESPGGPRGDRGATSESPAYVMYTSGSSGRPKGVAVPHRAIARLVTGAEYLRFAPDEVWLQLSPASFDPSTLEIWGSLCHGARLVLPPPGLPSPAELGRLIRRERVSTVVLTAALFHRLVEQDPGLFRPVRQLLVGGDVLSPASVRRLWEGAPRCRLINGYGPTENTTLTTCHRVTPEDARQEAVPIGRPIANTRVYVLDRAGEPAPIGVPGELCAAGDGLALGYVGQPELTAERFALDPFARAPGARLYRTGDRARYRPDGTLEFLGRLDDQVKIRGHRVEPGEVEAVLGGHPGVRQAVVTAPADPSGARRLVAHVILDPASPPEPEALRAYLRSRLPDHLVPVSLVVLEALPLTAHGKVDRAALPAPPPPTRAEAPPDPPVGDDITRRLTTIWEEVLRVRPIGPREGFFDLGGHSLLAVALMARIERVFDRPLPLATLFEAPTIEAQARLLRGESPAAPWRALVPIQAGGRRLPLFVLPGVGGTVLGYGQLTRALPSDQPVFGLEARGLDGSRPPFATIEEMAAQYLTEIRAVQPAGPYHLAGACVGGLVAFEMARRLCASGETVGALVLIDAWPPAAGSGAAGRERWPWLRAATRVGGRRLAAHLAAWRGLGPGARRAYLLATARRAWQAWSLRASAAVRREIYLDVVAQANVRASLMYAPPTPYPGRLVLIRPATRERAGAHDAQLRWRELAQGGLEVRWAPGVDSGQMLLEPHVGRLAREIEVCLARAREAGTPPTAP